MQILFGTMLPVLTDLQTFFSAAAGFAATATAAAGWGAGCAVTKLTAAAIAIIV